MWLNAPIVTKQTVGQSIGAIMLDGLGKKQTLWILQRYLNPYIIVILIYI
jgi:hypothetical protein